MAKPRDDRRMSFIVIPHGGDDLGTRSFELTYRQLRIAVAVAAAVGVALLVMVASWFWVAAQAARVPGLKRDIAVLEKDRQRVEELARNVADMEAQYAKVRALLGGNVRRDTIARDTASPDSAAADSAKPKP
ncbi:MAG TPA: hypothetical protein VFE05_17120 [Longimicrobiaceae bacterium]|nr:hypothetical protein [Longimicrobiaceae bacterium]